MVLEKKCKYLNLVNYIIFKWKNLIKMIFHMEFLELIHSLIDDTSF